MPRRRFADCSTPLDKAISTKRLSKRQRTVSNAADVIVTEFELGALTTRLS
jgi:hypothetical protein